MIDICPECGNHAKKKEEDCSLCDGTGKAKADDKRIKGKT